MSGSLEPAPEPRSPAAMARAAARKPAGSDRTHWKRGSYVPGRPSRDSPSPQNRPSQDTYRPTHVGGAGAATGRDATSEARRSSAQARDTATGSATDATRTPSSWGGRRA